MTSETLLDLAYSWPGAMVMQLTVDGEPIAFRFGFAHRGSFFSYLSSYDPAFAQYSPGKLLTDYSLSVLRERGFTTFDMLPPEGEHKRVWCSDAVAVSDYALPLTGKGRAYARLVDHALRPSMYWAWRHLPAILRARVARAAPSPRKDLDL